MSNELTDVRCPCGTEFPADSYDAGFIAGSGMCQNCDAALPPKDICTCPSGDGSLAHPCPAHPAVEQAGGDERAAFFKHLIGRHPAHETEIVRVVEHNYAAWKAWQARAALAQPSPASDLDPFNLAPHAEAFNEAPAEALKSDQAEVERPEVVAWRYGFSGGIVSDKACLDEWKSGGEYQSLMTVAQHERIAGQLHDALDESDGDRWRLRYERDAALARVAELTATRNRYGVDAHYFNKNLQRILRDFESFTPDELARSLIILAKVADEKVVAQAQHSVPDGYALVPLEPTDDMLVAGQEAWTHKMERRGALEDCEEAGDVYRAMLAAAPGNEGV